MIDPTGINDISRVAAPASPTTQPVTPAGEKGFYEVMLDADSVFLRARDVLRAGPTANR